MAERCDAIDYMRSRRTPLALTAAALFDGADVKKAYRALTADQSRDGSWNDSLAQTVQGTRLLLKLGYETKDPHVADALEWILWQQGLTYSYREVFPAPTEREMKGPLTLPTGERLPSRVSYRHIQGELALRVLIEAGLRDDPRVKEMLKVFDSMVRSSRHGIYCCRNCTGAFWQVAARFPRYRMHVAEGLKTMKNYRTPAGGWRGFPFYFILETLGQIRGMLALEEFEFALARLARNQNRDGSWGRKCKEEKTFAVLSGIHALRVGEV